jgi:hypothetical protein
MDLLLNNLSGHGTSEPLDALSSIVFKPSEGYSKVVQKKERYGPIYTVFWAALAVSLAISVYLGLNSTFVWYMERQSYKMYETMLIGATILLLFVILAGRLRVRRLSEREKILENVLATLSSNQGNEINTDDLTSAIEILSTKRKRSWPLLSPLILMAALFLVFSGVALVLLSPFLVENYQINAAFILFAGSISKIAIGLESVILFRYMIS